MRSPHSVRYPDAGRSPGRAAEVAAAEKIARYGESVLPVPVESYGRLGAAARDTLHVLAQAAGVFMGDIFTPSRHEPTWHARCETAVLFAVDDEAELCLCTSLSSNAAAIFASGVLRGGLAPRA